MALVLLKYKSKLLSFCCFLGSIENICREMCIRVCSLWALRSLRELLHDVNELVSPVSG